MTGSGPEPGQAGLGVVVDGGACWFTAESAGDFADPSEAQLEALARDLGIAGRAFARSLQVHGSQVRFVAGPGEAGYGGEFDGQVTTSREVVCAVRAADCVPVALFSRDAAGMVHAGWRGLAGGVIESGVRAVRGAGDREVAAVIGPCARSCCYQAGEEVHGAFAGLGPQARKGDRADLPWIVAALLARAGVTEVADTEACTICGRDPRWPSYRRDGESSGRLLGMAWRS